MTTAATFNKNKVGAYKNRWMWHLSSCIYFDLSCIDRNTGQEMQWSFLNEGKSLSDDFLLDHYLIIVMTQTAAAVLAEDKVWMGWR